MEVCVIEVNIGEMLEKRARRNISQTSRIEISTTAFTCTRLWTSVSKRFSTLHAHRVPRVVRSDGTAQFLLRSQMFARSRFRRAHYWLCIIARGAALIEAEQQAVVHP